jgi:hypothetical protein
VTVEYRYARLDEYVRISEFINQHWAKGHIYVRTPQLFAWTFNRKEFWDRDGYSFALAEDKGELVGILGGIPFLFNQLGRTSLAVWLANYMVRSDYRRGPVAIRLLHMLRRAPYMTTIAFGITPRTAPIYQSLRWGVLKDIPRHFAVLPAARDRMVHLLRLAYPDWPVDRAEALARCFLLDDSFRTPSESVGTVPPDWDARDWPRISLRTVGAARDSSYLNWRYLNHPCFAYRMIVVPEGNYTGMLIWRLETIHHCSTDDFVEVDRIGRMVEFLPVSRKNAQHLLASFRSELEAANVLGADYYGFHGEIGEWLNSYGFRSVATYPDGQSVPARFQPLDQKGGRIWSAVWTQDSLFPRSDDQQSPWYWTKSDADQDRPN